MESSSIFVTKKAASWQTALLWTALLWIPLALVQLRWIAADTRPLDCDPANHTIRALDYTRALQKFSPNLFVFYWRHAYSPGGKYTYPPLYHVVLGVAYYFTRFFTTDPSRAVFVTNMAFLPLLLYSVIQLGRQAFDLTVGVVAAALVATYSDCADLQHEAFIEFALTAACAYSVWRLLLTDGFARRRSSIIFGICLGLSLLIKHMAAVYLFGPVLWILWSHRRSWNMQRFTHALLALAVALVISSSWYALHLHDILQNFQANRQYPIDAGIPMPWTAGGMLFYLNAMWVAQTGCLLFFAVLAAAGIWIASALRRRPSDGERHEARGLILAYLLVGLLLLTFAFTNKDDRFSIPILPALALFTCGGFFGFLASKTARFCAIAVLVLGALPYYCVTMFDWPPVTRNITFSACGLDWDIWSKEMLQGPRAQQWPILPILQRVMSAQVTAPSAHRPKIGLLPYYGRFSGRSFGLEAVLCDFPIDIESIGDQPVPNLRRYDFLLTKDGDQGEDFLSGHAIEMRQYILAHPEEFRFIAKFPLPGQSPAELYQALHPQPAPSP